MGRQERGIVQRVRDRVVAVTHKVKELSPAPNISGKPDLLLARTLADANFPGGIPAFRRALVKGLVSVPQGAVIQGRLFDDVQQRLQRNEAALPSSLRGANEYVASIITGFSFYTFAHGTEKHPATVMAAGYASILSDLYSDARVAARKPGENTWSRLITTADVMKDEGLIRQKMSRKNHHYLYLTKNIDPLLE